MSAGIRTAGGDTYGALLFGTTEAVKWDATGLKAGSFAPSSIVPNDLSQKMTLGTVIDLAGKTAVDFTGIPAWAKRITVMLNGVSLNASINVILQLGTTTGVESTGYLGQSSLILPNNSSALLSGVTTGVVIYGNTAVDALEGSVYIHCMGANTYIANGSVATGADGLGCLAYSKTLVAALDRIRITSQNGISLFDAGTINIMYEG